MSKASPVWAQVMVPLLKRWQAELTAAEGQLSDHANSISQMDQRRAWVSTLLLREDEDVLRLLEGLHRKLSTWEQLDHHGASREQGILDQHLEMDRELADAVCGLVDHLTTRAAAHKCLRDVEEQIADEVDAERRLGSNLLHILDGLDVDDASHLRMRASIDKLMDRVQFWREHPGDAYDGHHVADVLMPIIRQLLEHSQEGGAT